MFARITLVEIDPLRTDPGAAVEQFRRDVLPELKQQPGYEGVYVLLNPDGKAMLISLWATPDSAQSSISNGYYEAQLHKFMTVFRSPPGREQYEVVLTETPQRTAL